MVLELARAVEYAIAFLALYVTIFFVLLYLQHRHAVVRTLPLTRSRPMVSVVIPAYNEVLFIEKCVRSVLRSDYPKNKMEIIVVDDGSTDATVRIVRSIRDPRVRIILQANSGKANALNRGIAEARGELIATLDADSYVRPNTLLRMLPFFTDPEVAAVTAAVKVKERGHRRHFLENIQRVEYLFTLFSRRVLNFLEAVPVTPGPFSLFRAPIFSRIGGFDPKSILEDQEMALRIQKHNYKIRSSLDAVVYTEIPRNFPDLLHQRIRWHRGGLHNTFKYLQLISPRYGDFGLIIMPLTFIALVALFGIFFVALVFYFFNASYYGALGWETLWLSLSPIHVIGAFIFGLNLLWILWGLALFKRERVTPWMVFGYILSYSYLLTLYWTAALLKELTFQKVSW